MLSVPATTATELAAAFLQAAVTLGLAALFAVLWRRYRKPYFGWFALAWSAYALRLGAIVSFLLSQNRIWLYWHQVVTGWTALALLWAALVFSRQLAWDRRYLLVVLFPPLWSFIAIYRLDNFLLAAGPAVAFLSAATIWTGWSFYRHHRRVGSRAAAYLAGALLLWGLHHLDYPFLRARGAWNPWGYYLDLLFVLAMGAGILLLVIEDLQRGVSALVALSSDLQRRDRGNDLPDTLLNRLLSLAGVTGAAMVTTAGGRYVRGVGSCASWTGNAPSGYEAAAVQRALAHGTPETVSVTRGAGPGGPHPPFAAALPVLLGDVVTGALVVVGEARDPFAALDTGFLVALGRQVGAALENVDLYRRLDLRSHDLERLATRMVDQHEDERRRLSRELHDETAQVFASVKLQLGVLREATPPGTAARLDRAMELIDAGIGSIRQVTDSLRPSLLDELGLLPALRALIEQFRGRSTFRVTFSAPASVPPLSDAAELALFRALQEGLANVARHAGANAVDVSLEVGREAIVLGVRDDGRGMDGSEGAGRMGLVGMRERIGALGGSVTIANDAEDGGARLVVHLPLLGAPA